ncbi:MAG: hypothetical protein H7255_12580 [Ramlibacter sp.]|nr:hypothetical protein [Ramlibacter sp.]
MRQVSGIVFLLLTSLAFAQSPPLDAPPEGSVPIEGEALRQRLSTKVFEFTAPGTSVTSRLQYEANGFVFLNVSTGLSDSAAWRVEGPMLCAEWKKIPPSCSEMRVKGDLLFARRLNGPWGTLTPK